MPMEVICIVLARPSGWSEVGDVPKALPTGPKRAKRVFDQSYERGREQEDWVNSQPFGRSGNILFKVQGRPVRAE
eukprot:7742771-Alexandrium_andersonii.AAC.1